MLVTKALPQDVAFLAFVPSLRRRAFPAGSFACDCRLRFRHRENRVAKGASRQHEHSNLHFNQLCF